jgi:hypothetical protein
MDAMPINEVLSQINQEPDPNIAFQRIINIGKDKLPSSIWDTFRTMNIETDILSAKNWIQKNLKTLPGATGIYLGLDTLNMDNGLGSNAEIGLSSKCNPGEFTQDWAYDCDYYGESHLLKGLFLVSDAFINEEKWTSDERSFAEYLIFLGYSGVVFREALLNVETKNDFLSIWGFHDGDMFFLVNRLLGNRTVIAGSDN